MKKIIAASLAILMIFALASCTTLTENNITSPADGTEAKTAVTTEAVAGEYVLTQMSGLGNEGYTAKAEDYEENKLTFTKDGKFTLSVKYKESSDKKDGSYEVSADGSIKLEEGAFIAANGENIKFDGEKITVNGKLGTQVSVSLVYENKDKAEAGEKEEK
ncbi:MAG: hypothetical protein J6036_00875 [Clostridia bacterium]|nr:hypothetical protein [Clostridia bacterium]